MAKKNSTKKEKQLKRKSAGQKGVIIGLSVALALAGGAAVAAPLVIMAQNRGGTGDAKTYTVKFDSDGGSSVKDQTILDGKCASEPACTKTGYILENWYKDGAIWDFNTPVTSDLTLKANWTPSPTPTTNITVTFNLDGGSIAGMTGDTMSVAQGTTYGQLPKPTKNNYSFDYWSVNGLEVQSETTIPGDVTVLANWTTSPTPTTHTVTFQTNGGSTIKAQQVVDGNTATEPKDPTKSGETFDGWYADSGLTTLFSFTTAITKDTTIYAKWSTTPVTTITATFKAGDNGTFAGGETTFSQTFAKDTPYKNITKPEVTANDNYVHTGWTNTQGETIDPETIMSSDFTIVAAYTENPKKNTINILAEAGPEYNAWDITIKGLTTYTLLASDYDIYGKIKSSLPVATCGEVGGMIPTFEYWSKEKQTSTESSEMPTAIQDNDPITNGDKLYPVFSFTSPATNVTLTVQLTGDQRITSGSQTIKATYKAGSADNVTFGQLNKPEIYEGTTKTSFSGYYKDASYNTAWPNDEVIDGSSTNIYVKMVEPITDPVINFAIDPTWAESHTNFQWVGNQEIKISSGDKLCDLPVPSVYSDATVYPSAAIGFKTDYYFEGWYLSTDTAEEKTLLQPGYTFTSSCTLYPKFGKKTNLVFQTYTEGATETEDYTARHLESDVWTDIVKPSTINMPANHVFIGWQGQTISAAEPQMLDDTTKVSDLDKTGSEDPTTKTIIPISADMTTVDCHIFNFIETASDGTSVTLVGNKQVGILASPTETITINDKLNKPLVPNVDESGSEINSGISFNNEWEITDTDPTGGATVSWTKLSSQTIAAGSANKTYWLRPVIIHNVSVTFDAGTEGAIKSGSINPVSVNPSTKFANMYRPEVEPNTNKIFLYWADVDGNQIPASQTFTANTTLYAVYDDDDVASTINLMVAQGDLDDPTFPATKINDANSFSVSIVHKPNETVKFEDFAIRVPTKPCHELAGWTTEWKESWEECELIADETVIPAGQALNLYAVFKPDDGNYHKITIAEPSTEGEYYLDGDTTMYAKAGATADYIDTVTGQWLIKENNTIKFNSNVWAVGKKITGWTKSDGTALPAAFSEDIEVKPVLADADPVYVSFKTSTDYTLSSTEQKPMKIHDKLSTYLATTGWAPTATKTKATFNKWAIYNGEDEDPTPITEDLRISGAITLVPQFVDESIFEGSSDPYYYDEDKKMWAAIKTFYDPEEYYHETLGVYYQDGTEGEVNKSTFNYEIKFGSQMTKIPDYFMYGCTSWNNGGEPLYFPKEGATSSSLVEIGKNVMYGCTSFNQPIHILSTSDYDINFKIGQNFMRGCTQFNQNITIEGKCGSEKGTLSLYIGDGFMFECNMFSKTLDISSWQNFGYLTWLGEMVDDVDETNFYSCLSTTDPNCPSFTLNVRYGSKSAFEALFPSMTGYETAHPYRWTYRSITVTEPE